jgi:peptide/nickel transport system permease protein
MASSTPADASRLHTEPGRSAAVLRRLAKGLLTIGLTLLGLLAVTFFIGRLMPVDPVVAIIGEQADQATYDTVYRQLGLDKPLPEQFFVYVRSIFSGDFGYSLTTGNPVAEDLRRVWPATLELATLALLLGVLAGVPLGIAAAIYQNSAWDHLVRLFSLVGHSIPNFWLGLMALVLFYAKLGWIGGAGRTSLQYIDALDPVTGSILLDTLLARRWDMFADALRHVIMPALILANGSMAFLSRMTRSFMLEQLNQEYIVTAKLKGLGKAGMVAHALRNTGVQLVTIIVLSYGGLLDGAVLTETVFAWPGFGRYMTTGLMNGDMNVTLACVFLVGALFITLNLCADTLYRVLDPRTR